MVTHFRLVPAAVFMYDCSRLLFLLLLLNSQLNSGFGLYSGHIPLAMYTAPNALFPLMSLFLFIFPDRSRAYIPLYITGKAISLLCLIVWLFFAFRQILDTSRIMWAVFFCAADIGTIMGMLLQNFDARYSENITKIDGGE